MGADLVGQGLCLIAVVALIVVPLEVDMDREQMEQLAREKAREHDIAEEVFLRLIDAESGWNPRAVNPRSGCRGLAQISPRFFMRDHPDRLFEPEMNLSIAASYLGGLLRTSGDYVRALACYNWGPGNVLDAETQHGPAWILDIPNETKRYIRKILFIERAEPRV